MNECLKRKSKHFNGIQTYSKYDLNKRKFFRLFSFGNHRINEKSLLLLFMAHIRQSIGMIFLKSHFIHLCVCVSQSMTFIVKMRVNFFSKCINRVDQLTFKVPIEIRDHPSLEKIKKKKKKRNVFFVEMKNFKISAQLILKFTRIQQFFVYFVDAFELSRLKNIQTNEKDDD